MKRHVLLTGYLVVAVVMLCAASGASAESGNTTVTKEAMLQSTAHNVILPAYQELHSKCEAMTNAIGEFNKNPAPDSLRKARQAWLDALLSARRIQWVQSGPVADREVLARLYYPRVLPYRVEEAVHSDKHLDDVYLEEIGTIARGMFAIEYLLFGQKAYPPADPKTAEAAIVATFSQPADKRRKEVLLWLAQDLESKCGLLVKDWSASGPDSVAGKFVVGGQQTVNVLVNDLARVVEQVEEGRVHFLLQLRNPLGPQMNRIENSPSDSSKANLVAMVEGLQKLFGRSEANSLGAYLKKVNPKAGSLIDTKLDATAAAVAAIPGPLEDVIQTNRDPVQATYEKLHELEIFCKVDLASSLGVTITFNSNDGD